MDKKNIVIGALIFAICVMSIGYAALSTTLTINGTATISQDWNIAITDIAIDTSSSSAAETYAEATPASHTDTTATFDVTLKQPGAYVTYDITIKNKGTIAGNLDAVVTPTITAPNLEIIDYTIEQQPASSLAANDNAAGGLDETVLKVKVKYVEGKSLDDAQSAVDTTAGTTGNPVQEKATITVTYSAAS